MDENSVAITNPALDLLCHQGSLGLCTAPDLLVWLATHRRIPGKEKAKIMFLLSIIWMHKCCSACRCKKQRKQNNLKLKLKLFWGRFVYSTHLFFGHVQESHRVSLSLDICPHCVQGFVKLPLNIRQLFKNLAGWPQQHLQQGKEPLLVTFTGAFHSWKRNWKHSNIFHVFHGKTSRFITVHFFLPGFSWTLHPTCKRCGLGGWPQWQSSHIYWRAVMKEQRVALLYETHSHVPSQSSSMATDYSHDLWSHNEATKQDKKKCLSFPSLNGL